ncbi:MAG: MBOAT family protein [Lachnospiraceae bacterium]|nr:MBOAT family protein [Lachnospiraceae bacterium]
MLFNSFQFLIFFPIVILIYFICPDKILRMGGGLGIHLKNLWLLAASYYFYMSWNAKYGLLLLFCTIVTYIAARSVDALRNSDTGPGQRRRTVFVVSLILIFSILVYYKYFNFLLNNLVQLFSAAGIQLSVPSFDIVLPVGISFFTFQAAGYLIDVYRGDTRAEQNFLQYALFVSFFPQLVAGPIERSNNLLKQLAQPSQFDYERARDGFYLMLWGYFMKMVIADRAAVLVDNIYNSYTERTGAAIVLATIVFAFQVYGDFGGYSTIAMGAAKVLGVDLIDNFKSPYLSTSIGELWGRWHISLNAWFKDYLYIPLGGGRKGKVRKYINLIIVFLVSGLWHGARWSYVMWGGLNGLYSIAEALAEPLRKRFRARFGIDVNSFSHRLWRWLTTFALFDFSTIFFRAAGAGEALYMIRKIVTDFSPSSVLAGAQYSYGLDENNFKLLILSVILLLIADYCKCRGICIREKLKRQETWFRVLTVSASILFIVVFGVWGNAYNAKSFIYFQF